MAEPDNQEAKSPSPAKAGDVVHPADGDTSQPQPTPANDHEDMPKRSKRWVIPAVILVVLAAVAGGYYYWQQHKAKPAAVAVKKDVALIRVGTNDGPVNVFYPSKDLQAVSGMQLVNDQIFEGLVGWQGGTKLVPLLATSWTNPDDSTWLFTLRSGVKFHSGHTMTADDVKFSLDKSKDVYENNFGSTIKEVTVVSPTQVKVTTDGPDPLLLNRLANFYIVDAKGAKPDDPANGTGPYTLKGGTDPTKDPVTDLVANDSYWGGHVYTRELQFSEIASESDILAAFKDHKIDVFDIIIDQSTIKQLKASGVSILSQPSLAVTQISFNTLKKSSPLGNLKFRQALNIGIDRGALITAAGVDGRPMGQYITPTVPGYVPKLTPPTQDVTAAKALIAQSGIKNATLTVSYGTSASNTALLTEFAKQAANLGVTIKLDPIESIDDLVTKFSDGKTDMMFVANSSSLFDGSDILSLFQMPGVYENATLDDLLNKANQTIDGSKHLDLLQQAAQAVNDDMGGLPLYTRNAYFGQASSGYKLSVEIPSVDAGVYFWKVYQQ